MPSNFIFVFLLIANVAVVYSLNAFRCHHLQKCDANDDECEKHQETIRKLVRECPECPNLDDCPKFEEIDCPNLITPEIDENGCEGCKICAEGPKEQVELSPNQ